MAGDVFTPVEFEWDGRTYTVKSHRVMGLICRIEQHITLGELHTYGQRGTAPLGSLCSAYAAALNYAGARVTADEVYGQVFASTEDRDRIMNAVGQVMMMMLPAAERQRLENAAAEAETEGDVLGKAKATAVSSKPRTRRRSRSGNG